jgi:eukaryotic-like serine/threonine-protein kinase
MSKHAFEDWIGKVIKGYRLEEILGVGGVGCVFRATHTLIKKQVAIKILQNTDPTAKVLERFIIEAKAANEIRHENVIDVIDFDQTDEKTPFMIMEYLYGKSLASAIEEEAPFPEARISRIALQICAALSAAHSHGIIHRDLKGDNIFLTTRGEERDFVKILDFGIAKILYDNGNRTQTGLMIGTPLCMAPEQALGLQVSASVDIYALGVLLFQLCTGRSPFEHDIPMIIVSMHVEAPAPSPRQYNSAVSTHLESIISRCLQKKPEDRFASMEELAKMLEALQRPTINLKSDPLALSFDMTSPFINLPQKRPTLVKPAEAPEPERTTRVVREPQDDQMTPLRTDTLVRSDPPQKAPTPPPSSTRSNPVEASLLTTLIDPSPAASTLRMTVKSEAERLAPIPVFMTGEQTTVDDRSKRVMADKIINTMKPSTLGEPKKVAPLQASGSSLFFLGVGVLLTGLLIALLLGLF